uniref:Uncharacterized protein n=1 Tax=viral metagenome TaxID=1070528 RepID=A0A6M3L8G4_9ZZZZ
MLLLRCPLCGFRYSPNVLQCVHCNTVKVTRVPDYRPSKTSADEGVITCKHS